MPRAALRLGAVDQQLPLPAIAAAIVRAVAQPGLRWRHDRRRARVDSAAARLLDARIGLKPDLVVPAATRSAHCATSPTR